VPTPSGKEFVRGCEDYRWSNSPAKRIFDCAAAALALIILGPFMLIVALAVKLTSEGPILFRQTRMGRNGQRFEILKFRSMEANGGKGPCVTKAGDARLTSIGDSLRKTKLDELPQLINVLKGDMSLVGPRPKLPHHQTYTLRVRPGVTGAASLAFRDEERFLHRVPEHALDYCQINLLMPLKRELDDRYLAQASFLSDLAVLWRTVSGSHKPADTERVCHLQTSLISLSQALGQSVPPAPSTQAENQLPTRRMVAQ
jgi:lipopolysaccharide/colanic/teichoic acid biosynthesis glycosyltransferase